MQARRHVVCEAGSSPSCNVGGHSGYDDSRVTGHHRPADVHGGMRINISKLTTDSAIPVCLTGERWADGFTVRADGTNSSITNIILWINGLIFQTGGVY